MKVNLTASLSIKIGCFEPSVLSLLVANNQLSKRERDIKTNDQTDVDIVEKDNLLRRIRVERRDLNHLLADLSLQRSLIENNVDEKDEDDTEDYT